MSTRLQAKRISLPGPSGALESLVEEPKQLEVAAFGVICHPHSLYGGTLENKVVYTAARAFQECGAPTIRFNFRGVGGSAGQFADGAGETDDTLAVIAHGRERWPGASVWLAGFSFGGAVAIRAAAQVDPMCLVTIAPAISRVDLTGITMPRGPWLVVQGGADELVNAADIVSWSEGLQHRPELILLPDVGHFFHGKLNELRSAITGFIGKQKPG